MAINTWLISLKNMWKEANEVMFNLDVRGIPYNGILNITSITHPLTFISSHNTTTVDG